MTSTKSPSILIPRAATTEHRDGTYIEIDAIVDALLLGREDRVHEGPRSWDAVLVGAYRRLHARLRLARDNESNARDIMRAMVEGREKEHREKLAREARAQVEPSDCGELDDAHGFSGRMVACRFCRGHEGRHSWERA